MYLKRMLKSFVAISLVGAMSLSLVGCSGNSKASGESKSVGKNEPIIMVWYPNESAEEYAPAREEFGKLIEDATGRPVEQKLTTDYAIAIESMANGTADICFMGAQGYVEAKNKSDSVKPLFVNSGPSGTLDDAIYYSFLNVLPEKEEEYKKDGEFSIDNIEGKKISFVSNSSTSGFKVPSTSIIEHFSKTDKWKDMDVDLLIEGGEDYFFSEVLFAGSHQGSAINLLTGKSDISAFCDTEIAPYAEICEGEVSKAGAVYKIKEDSPAPFESYRGDKFVVIKSTPVQNGPFAYNADTLSEEEVKAIQDIFLSEETINNTKIFITEESGNVGLFKKEGNEKIIIVEDEWYDPMREM